MPLLEAQGVDSANLDRGAALYHETIQLIEQQKKKYQKQNLAYDRFNIEKEKAKASFKRTLKLVKVLAGNDSDLQDRLNLYSGPVFAIEPWIDHSISFYNRLLNEVDLLTKLEQFKINTDRIKAEQKAIKNLRRLRDEAIAAKEKAQEAKWIKNKKLDELEQYSKVLKIVAKIALEKQSQLLEKLGLLVRS